MADIGSIIDGTVSGVMLFGVFVDFGSGESGLVHISELSNNYVKEINDFVKKGDAVKVKVIGIGDDGKISLSIKQAEPPKKQEKSRPKPKSARPDSFDWLAKSTEELSFEDKMLKFKHESEEKIRDSKRRMENKRSGGYSRKGY